MALDEIFPNPVVKQVIFEIKFSNLFFLESRIGDFQIKIMREFPESELAVKRSFVLGHGTDKGLQEVMKQPEVESATKVWQFTSPDGVQLAVSSRSLSLSSSSHSSYHRGARPFRRIIGDAVKHFFDVTSLPVVTRVGLRYINECPIPERTTAGFRNWYSTVLPLDRFPLEQINEMNFVNNCKLGNRNLQYIEVIRVVDQTAVFFIDIDASAGNVPAESLVDELDKLHELIESQFEATIKEPLKQYMREEKK